MATIDDLKPRFSDLAPEARLELVAAVRRGRFVRPPASKGGTIEELAAELEDEEEEGIETLEED